MCREIQHSDLEVIAWSVYVRLRMYNLKVFFGGNAQPPVMKDFIKFLYS